MKKQSSHAQGAVHCVAEGREESWEAFCLDFDLAVQGKSFEEVYAKLNDQIHLYIETAFQESKADRERLMNRRAPISVTMPMMLRVIGSTLLRRGITPRHDYVVPMGNYVAA